MWIKMEIILLLLIVISSTTCQLNGLEYSLTEGPTSELFLVNIKQDSPVISAISDTELLQNIKFKIVNSGGSDVLNSMFVVIEDSGELQTTGQIDREDICPQEKTCEVSLDISAFNQPDYFQIIKVSILINDTNDNSPSFDGDLFKIEIPENAVIGSRFQAPKAIDLDSPLNGIKGYRIYNSINDEIGLETEINDQDESVVPILVLRKHLDREAKFTFNMLIEAFDSVDTTSANVDSITVKITATDVNDNAPVFVKDIYTLTVPENYERQSNLLQVEATDLDTGDNGDLVYSFDSSTSAKYSHLMTLDSFSGEITLVDYLDYEVNQTIELTILAIEKNPTHMPARCKVIITIADVNDNNPTITVNPVSGTANSIEISENIKSGAFLAHISVSDRDTGENGKVFCTVYSPLNEDVFLLENLSEYDYKLVTNSSLDREIKDDYIVVFVCRDGGSPSLIADHETKVIILDENDNNPVFQQEKITLQIYENNPVGAELVYLNATDLDSGLNGEVVFQVLQENRYIDGVQSSSSHIKYISIDTYSGNVTAKLPFDYEQDTALSYEIIAYDKGELSNTATATININVMDLNDEPPKFSELEYVFYVYENQDIGADVGTVEAYDPDSSSNNNFYFGLVYGSPNSNLFMVERSSGSIFTRVTFDREEINTYVFPIRVYDSLLPSQYSTIDVIVKILDTNDHAPVVIFPTEDNNTFTVKASSDGGDMPVAVTQIIAYDNDIDLNSILEYTFINTYNDDINDIFLIDQTTGIIYVKNMDKLQKSREYELEVSVTDKGEPFQESRIKFFVQVDGYSDMLAVNTVIIIAVGVISGVVVSSLAIAILLIKMRIPKSKISKNTMLPAHYTVQHVEMENETRDDISELSVNVLNSTLPHISPLPEVIAPSNTLKGHPDVVTDVSRDQFSDESNSDSGMGSHEEGISTISANVPVISIDTGNKDDGRMLYKYPWLQQTYSKLAPPNTNSLESSFSAVEQHYPLYSMNGQLHMNQSEVYHANCGRPWNDRPSIQKQGKRRPHKSKLNGISNTALNSEHSITSGHIGIANVKPVGKTGSVKPDIKKCNMSNPNVRSNMTETMKGKNNKLNNQYSKPSHIHSRSNSEELQQPFDMCFDVNGSGNLEKISKSDVHPVVDILYTNRAPVHSYIDSTLPSPNAWENKSQGCSNKPCYNYDIHDNNVAGHEISMYGTSTTTQEYNYAPVHQEDARELQGNNNNNNMSNHQNNTEVYKTAVNQKQYENRTVDIRPPVSGVYKQNILQHSPYKMISKDNGKRYPSDVTKDNNVLPQLTENNLQAYNITTTATKDLNDNNKIIRSHTPFISNINSKERYPSDLNPEVTAENPIASKNYIPEDVDSLSEELEYINSKQSSSSISDSSITPPSSASTASTVIRFRDFNDTCGIAENIV